MKKSNRINPLNKQLIHESSKKNERHDVVSREESATVFSENAVRKGIFNTAYVVFAELISFGLSFLTAFVLPGALGVVPFGYYQVYIFYTGYVGIFHFGFADGVYLRYGSYDYDRLPKELFRSFGSFLTIIDSIVAALFLAVSCFEKDPLKRFAYFFAALNIVVLNLSSLFNYINQISGRIKKFSFVVIAEKVQIIAAVSALIYFKNISFKFVIIADFAAKAVVLIINIYNCRDIVFGRRLLLKEALPECTENINAGIKLMLANFMGLLVMGLGRFILERFGSVADFGLYSFAVSSTGIAMMFVTSVSIILYPVLCRLDKSSLPKILGMLNSLLCAVVFIMLLMYYPLVFVVRHWLTKYISILGYLYLLFPIVIMSSKMELLINTFYKSLREEKAMLKANMSSVVMFAVIVLPGFYFYRSILVIVWATLFTFTWRCYASEVFLKKKLGIGNHINIIEEIIMAAAFIIAAGIIKGAAGFFVYLLFIIIYLALNRKQLTTYARSIADRFKYQQPKNKV